MTFQLLMTQKKMMTHKMLKTLKVLITRKLVMTHKMMMTHKMVMTPITRTVQRANSSTATVCAMATIIWKIGSVMAFATMAKT